MNDDGQREYRPKLNIIQYLFGIRSMRQTIKEVEVNTAYRWYIGYGLSEKIPHFSTFSKNYARRFEGTDLFEQIFTRVIAEIIKHGFIDEENDIEPEQKEIKQSTSDPDCGVFHKGEHKKVFAYTANVACDRHNYILGFETTAGNLHDSTVFPLLYNKLKAQYEGIKNVIVDAGYKIPAIAKMIIDDGKTPIMPLKTENTS